jgi:hypothetical protein
MTIKTANAVTAMVVMLSVVFSSGAYSASKRKDAAKPLPVQIKPERMEVLDKIANEKIATEDFVFDSFDEMKNFYDLIENEERILAKDVNVERLYRTLNVDFSPKSVFHTIHLSPNFNTTVVFVDKNGNPWTISKYVVGAATNFTTEQQTANILTFSPISNVANSNLTVFFKGSNKPISVNLQISSKKVDYITEMRIDEIGDRSPKESFVSYVEGGASFDFSSLSKYEKTFMSEILSDVKPLNYDEKYAYHDVTGVLEEDFRVFHKEGEKHIYIRTRHEMFSPNPLGESNSADKKIKVFKVPFATSIVVTKDGKLEQLRIK